VIIGAHSIVYSKNPEADRAFLRDVLKLPSVDVGGGWLIFGLPLAEVAVAVKSARRKATKRPPRATRRPAAHKKAAKQRADRRPQRWKA